MSGVIITAPHSHCFQERDDIHTCDYVSGECAKLIYSSIKKKDAFLSTNNIPRYQTDMNRSVSRTTDFRNRIRNLFDSADYLFDIHSFPLMKKIPFSNEVYILDDEEPFSQLTEELFEYLTSKGYKCNRYRGKQNDIITEARHNGLQAVLVEINEDLDVERMNSLCVNIGRFIDSLR